MGRPKPVSTVGDDGVVTALAEILEHPGVVGLGDADAVVVDARRPAGPARPVARTAPPIRPAGVNLTALETRFVNT